MSHVIGFIGTKLDRATNEPGRWNRWRPTLGLCQQQDFVVDRLDLLYDPRHQGLADQVVADLAQVSPETELQLNPMSIKDPWDFQEVYESLFDYFRSTTFDKDPDTFVHVTTGTHVIQICLFLLTESRHFPGKLIQTRPARGRRSRDAAGDMQIIDLDLSKYDRLASRFEKDQAEARDFLRSGIATKNQSFNKLIDEIEVVALRSEAPLLLSGPTGAGKTHLARRIYQLRTQRCDLRGSFVEVNCATLRGDAAMSTLFGHKKGAFTGAHSDRKGLLREADNGLVFLDEIGELGLDEQAMLLRTLEDRTFLPLGSDQPASSNFQLIAGTNRELQTSVANGSFREDLYTRINLWSFQLPSLAERREDIAPNLDYELQRFEQESGRAVRFNKESRKAFLSFAESPATQWRGNFRDLNAAVTRMATLADRGRIKVADVVAETERLHSNWGQHDDSTSVLTEIFASDKLADIDPFDQVQLAHVVDVCRSSRNLSDAGRTLFAATRKKKVKPNDSDRLRKYLAKFDLRFDEL